MMVSRHNTLSKSNPPQLHEWRRNSSPDQTIRHATIGGRRTMVSSCRRGELVTPNSPILSAHQILMHMCCNLNTETLQAWEDCSNMLNSMPPTVAIEGNKDLLDDCGIEFQTRILELTCSNLAKCFR